MSETAGASLGQRLEVRDIEDTDTAVLTLLDPHLDYTCSDEVKARLGQAVTELAEETGKTRFVVNLGNVDALDSSGLAVLISLRKKLHAVGGVLVICHLCTMIRRLFELTGLDRAFDIFETEDEAVHGG